jgi:uncharacterized membrane protein YhaH (DUF805 family)
MIGFQRAVATCLRKYVTFSGRARRPEYWWFFLFNVIVSAVSTLVDTLLGTGDADGGIISSLTTLALTLPAFAVTWRRLHDTGRPGWYALAVVAVIIFISATVLLFLNGENPPPLPPMVLFWTMMATNLGGLILLLVWLVLPSQAGDNRFGPEPEVG